MNQAIEKPDKIFENIKAQLQIGIKNRLHGYHTPVFSNITKNGSISSKIIVLRGFDLNLLHINFHTDIRSKKIEELRLNPKTNFLFYDQKIKIQLRIKSISNINYNNSVTKVAWKNTSLSSRKCYLAQKPPSSNIASPSDSIPEHLMGINPNISESEKGYKNFSVIISQIQTIDWLFLSSSGHRRLLITINDTKNSYNWLIP